MRSEAHFLAFPYRIPQSQEPHVVTKAFTSPNTSANVERKWEMRRRLSDGRERVYVESKSGLREASTQQNHLDYVLDPNAVAQTHSMFRDKRICSFWNPQH